MSYFELRERVESATPWWAPFVAVIVVSVAFGIFKCATYVLKERSIIQRCNRGAHEIFWSARMQVYVCYHCRKRVKLPSFPKERPNDHAQI